MANGDGPYVPAVRKDPPERVHSLQVAPQSGEAGEEEEEGLVVTETLSAVKEGEVTTESINLDEESEDERADGGEVPAKRQRGNEESNF